MNLDKIKELATSKTARQVLLLKKHSPTTLFVLGTAGVVGATVLACRATLKLSEVLDQHDKLMTDVEAVRGDQNYEYTSKQVRKLQVRTALDIAKLYLPAVGLGLVSITALTGSQVILTKRNGAIVAAYTGLDRAFKEYRGRVVDAYGEDVDRKFVFGGEDVVVEEKTSDGKTKTTAKVKLPTTDRPGMSPYAALYDEKSHHFTLEPGMNSVILGIKQSHMNDKLRSKGHLFLNEVLDELGLPRTKAGQMAGWVWRRETEEKTGDNYVSFGIYDNEPGLVDQFMDGNNPLWLDFNVDGSILDLI